ncbi:MAG: nicotinate-nicotinamide nucleotide adenylyltransferase [Proteobacteria bacterium]|nr:MAG: nicotinate-nicotinamide nucleotide adenylyltransferase [Pseudomonadota bacterium]
MTHGLESNQEPTHIFYGGTFDPPHEGHALVVRLCLKKFSSAAVVVVPSFAPAGAYGRHKSVKTSFADRVKLCELAFADEIALRRVVVDRVEVDLPAPNYSWKTLEVLGQKYSGSRLALLLGFDQLQSLDGWQNADDLVRQYDIVAIDRPGFGALTEIKEQFASRFASPAAGRCLYILGGDGEVSSAQSRVIRADPEGAEAKEWLKPKVIEYIREQKLYGDK